MKTTTGGEVPDPWVRAAELCGSRIAIVGCAARTCYRDTEDVRAALETLGFLSGAELEVIHAQQLPFDDHVEKACAAIGLVPIRCWAPMNRADRGYVAYERPVAMLEDVGLLLAFPREDDDVTSADMLVVLAAIEAGIPILVVRRESAEFIG